MNVAYTTSFCLVRVLLPPYCAVVTTSSGGQNDTTFSHFVLSRKGDILGAGDTKGRHPVLLQRRRQRLSSRRCLRCCNFLLTADDRQFLGNFHRNWTFVSQSTISSHSRYILQSLKRRPSHFGWSIFFGTPPLPACMKLLM